MRLLRRLADDGHTILLITHATKNVMLCDQVLFLARGGYLAYFGPPDQALGYFGVQDFDGIYEKLEGSEKSPEEWGSTYLASRQYQEFVASRLAAQGSSAPAATTGYIAAPRQVAPPAGRTSSAMHQLRVLSVRYFELIRRDRVNFALLFLLAPALSLIDLVAWPRDVLNGKTGSGSTAMTMFFLGALIPFLVGSLSSVREIVKEAPIYARERAVSLKIWPYLGSKIVIGSLFALYHGAVLVAVKIMWIHWPGVDAVGFTELYVTLVLAVISGVMWALLISALTRREEQAMMLIIGLIVLQIVFSGGLVPLDSLGPAGLVLGSITSTAWTFKALVAAGGLTVRGCTGDMSGCTLPEMAGLADPGAKAFAYKGIHEKFGGVFDANIFVCWAAMLALIVVVALALYVLQKRKDRL
jgi:ABC transport system ATP-binding/permease protein